MARLEIDISAKHNNAVKTIGAVAERLEKLQREYNRTTSVIAGYTRQQDALQQHMRQLQSAYNAGTVSERDFNKETQKTSVELSEASGNIQLYNSRLTSLKATIAQLTNAQGDLGASTEKLEGYHRSFQNGIRSTSAVSVEFSRIVQDLPYAANNFGAVGNNITRVTELLPAYIERMKAAAAANGQTLTTGQAMGQVLKTSLTGWNAVTLAVSAVASAYTIYTMWQQKANKAAKEGADATKALATEQSVLEKSIQSTDYKKALTNLSELKANVDLAKEGLISKTDVVNQYNETIGKTTGKVKDFADVEDFIIRNSEAYVRAMLYRASATLALERAAEEALAAQVALNKTDSESVDYMLSGLANSNDPKTMEQYRDNAQRNRQVVADEHEKDRKAFEQIAIDFQRQAATIANEMGFDLFGGGSSGQSGAGKLLKALQESNNRVSALHQSAREQELQRIQQWYSSRLSLAEAGSEEYVQLENNMRSELAAANSKYDQLELKQVQDFLRKRNDKIAKDALKIRDENRNQDIQELKVSLDYQRRLYEGRVQIALRGLNAEYKLKEEALNKWVAAEINAGKKKEEIAKQVADKEYQLQQELYDKIDVLSAKQQNIDIQTAFDGDALSVPLAQINAEITKLRQNFQGLTEGEILMFQEKITELETQRQQLQLWQGTVDSISGAFGNLYADAIFDTENAVENLGKAFENTAKSIISGLIKIAARYVMNQIIAQATMKATAITSATTGAAVTTAWAPAAATSAVATFGGAVAAGGAALLALLATSKGFESGGYTGGMGRKDIAGVVHGQEFVINARATRDNLPLLKAINSGIDIASMMSPSQSVRFGRIDTNGASRVVIEQDTVRIGHDAIYISFKKGERNNTRFFGGR